MQHIRRGNIFANLTLRRRRRRRWWRWPLFALVSFCLSLFPFILELMNYRLVYTRHARRGKKRAYSTLLKSKSISSQTCRLKRSKQALHTCTHANLWHFERHTYRFVHKQNQKRERERKKCIQITITTLSFASHQWRKLARKKRTRKPEQNITIIMIYPSFFSTLTKKWKKKTHIAQCGLVCVCFNDTIVFVRFAITTKIECKQVDIQFAVSNSHILHAQQCIVAKVKKKIGTGEENSSLLRICFNPIKRILWVTKRFRCGLSHYKRLQANPISCN